MRFIIELWPDLPEGATPERLVQYAIESIRRDGENFTWSIQYEDDSTITVQP